MHTRRKGNWIKIRKWSSILIYCIFHKIIFLSHKILTKKKGTPEITNQITRSYIDIDINPEKNQCFLSRKELSQQIKD